MAIKWRSSYVNQNQEKPHRVTGKRQIPSLSAKRHNGVPSAATTVRAISICLIGNGHILSAARKASGKIMTNRTSAMPVRRNHFH